MFTSIDRLRVHLRGCNQAFSSTNDEPGVLVKITSAPKHASAAELQTRRGKPSSPDISVERNMITICQKVCQCIRSLIGKDSERTQIRDTTQQMTYQAA